MAAAVKIPLKVTPNAPKDEVVGWRGDVLAVKITAPPLEGRANRHLLRFVARVFDVPPADVTLVQGEASRTKTVQITGLSAAEANERLKQHLR